MASMYSVRSPDILQPHQAVDIVEHICLCILYVYMYLYMYVCIYLYVCVAIESLHCMHGNHVLSTDQATLLLHKSARVALAATPRATPDDQER